MEESQYRDKLYDERFTRDKERIEQHERHMEEQDAERAELREMSIKMGELLKRHDEAIEQHEQRIRAMEEKPSKNWSAIQSAAISAIVSGGVAALLNLILH